MTTFDVEIVLRERDYAVTEQLQQPLAPRQWTETEVASVLRDILLAIDRVKNPSATDRYVALRGFSWIVEPTDGGVVIAIEIPSGRRRGRSTSNSGPSTVSSRACCQARLPKP